jgi:hypothetical protein
LLRKKRKKAINNTMNVETRPKLRRLERWLGKVTGAHRDLFVSPQRTLIMPFYGILKGRQIARNYNELEANGRRIPRNGEEKLDAIFVTGLLNVGVYITGACAVGYAIFT